MGWPRSIWEKPRNNLMSQALRQYTLHVLKNVAKFWVFDALGSWTDPISVAWNRDLKLVPFVFKPRSGPVVPQEPPFVQESYSRDSSDFGTQRAEIGRRTWNLECSKYSIGRAHFENVCHEC